MLNFLGDEIHGTEKKNKKTLKNILNQIISKDDEVLRYSDHIIGSGEEVFKNACQMNLEGIVAKNNC